MHRSSKSRILFVWPFLPGDLRWPWPVLWSVSTGNIYLQMSVTLSMPIPWLCLRLTSKLCSPMSPSPKSRTFWLWPDLWSHQWPLGQIWDHVWKFNVQGYRMVLNFGTRPVVWEITGGPNRPPPPPTECVTRQSPTGRGLILRSLGITKGRVFPYFEKSEHHFGQPPLGISVTMIARKNDKNSGESMEFFIYHNIVVWIDLRPRA